MKASILQLTCSSVVLGLMAGAAGLHYHEVKRMGATSFESGPNREFVRPVVQADGPLPVSWIESDPGWEATAAEAGKRPEMEATVVALNEIVHVLRDLKDENRNLREQIKEANRDLTEMQFRIDTHSKSFRPLKVESEPVAPLNTGTQHPLLPPKPRN